MKLGKLLVNELNQYPEYSVHHLRPPPALTTHTVKKRLVSSSVPVWIRIFSNAGFVSVHCTSTMWPSSGKAQT